MVVSKKESVLVCPECGSDKLIKFGKKFAKRGIKRELIQQYQCKNCGRVTVNPKEE
jgi:transposase-like protein